MKKSFLIFVCTFLVFAGCAVTPVVTIPTEEREKTYLIDCPFEKDTIYDKALSHLSMTFNKANEAIQLKDKENGKIIAKASTVYAVKPSTVTAQIRCNFTLIVEAKDKRYRVQFLNPSYEYAENINTIVGTIGYAGQEANATEYVVNGSHKEFEEIMNNIDSYINSNDEQW